MDYSLTVDDIEEIISKRTASIIKDKGGYDGIAKALGTDLKTGISLEEKRSNFSERKKV
jgi:hypothetical protein